LGAAELVYDSEKISLSLGNIESDRCFDFPLQPKRLDQKNGEEGFVGAKWSRKADTILGS